MKKYIIFLKVEHVYTRANLTLEEAKEKHPDTLVTIKTNQILWSQDNPFTIEQIVEVKEKGFHHQFGFGPAYEKIPFEKIQFAKVEPLEV